MTNNYADTVTGRVSPASSRVFDRVVHLAGLSAETRERTTVTNLAEPMTPSTRATDALVERLFNATIDCLEVASVHIGGRLGFYRALADVEGATPGELAAHTGTSKRYVREWLEQQAVAGFLSVDEPDAPPDARRYRLPPEHRPVLVDTDDLNYLTPLAGIAVDVVVPIERILDAYRSGEGVPFEAYGDDLVDVIGAINRPQFLNLVTHWLGSIPELDARLRAEPPARVGDVAAGTAQSSIAIARAYPNVTVEAIDVDATSVERARANGGSVLIADERVAERFAPPGDEIERLNYGFSILHCLAVGLLDADSAGTGTVIRPDTVRAYATEAGFSRVDVLPIEHDFWRFYQLAP